MGKVQYGRMIERSRFGIPRLFPVAPPLSAPTGTSAMIMAQLRGRNPMARVPYLNPSDLAPENRDLLTRNINLYRALTHSPDATRSFLGLAQYIRYHSKLDPRLREMAI